MCGRKAVKNMGAEMTERDYDDGQTMCRTPRSRRLSLEPNGARYQESR